MVNGDVESGVCKADAFIIDSDGNFCKVGSSDGNSALQSSDV